jgi:hypothetical protein
MKMAESDHHGLYIDLPHSSISIPLQEELLASFVARLARALDGATTYMQGEDKCHHD